MPRGPARQRSSGWRPRCRSSQTRRQPEAWPFHRPRKALHQSMSKHPVPLPFVSSPTRACKPRLLVGPAEYKDLWADPTGAIEASGREMVMRWRCAPTWWENPRQAELLDDPAGSSHHPAGTAGCMTRSCAPVAWPTELWDGAPNLVKLRSLMTRSPVPQRQTSRPLTTTVKDEKLRRDGVYAARRPDHRPPARGSAASPMTASRLIGSGLGISLTCCHPQSPRSGAGEHGVGAASRLASPGLGCRRC